MILQTASGFFERFNVQGATEIETAAGNVTMGTLAPGGDTLVSWVSFSVILFNVCTLEST